MEKSVGCFERDSFVSFFCCCSSAVKSNHGRGGSQTPQVITVKPHELRTVFFGCWSFFSFHNSLVQLHSTAAWAKLMRWRKKQKKNKRRTHTAKRETRTNLSGRPMNGINAVRYGRVTWLLPTNGTRGPSAANRMGFFLVSSLLLKLILFVFFVGFFILLFTSNGPVLVCVCVNSGHVNARLPGCSIPGFSFFFSTERRSRGAWDTRKWSELLTFDWIRPKATEFPARSSNLWMTSTEFTECERVFLFPIATVAGRPNYGFPHRTARTCLAWPSSIT